MSSKLNTAIAVAGIDIGKNSFHVVGTGLATEVDTSLPSARIVRVLDRILTEHDKPLLIFGVNCAIPWALSPLRLRGPTVSGRKPQEALSSRGDMVKQPASPQSPRPSAPGEPAHSYNAQLAKNDRIGAPLGPLRGNLVTPPQVGRFEFTFTPKHGSWLNLVEGFFSKLARSVLRHIRVASKQELKDRIMIAMDEFWMNSIAIPSSTLGPISSIRPPDMIRISKSMNYVEVRGLTSRFTNKFEHFQCRISA